MEPKKTPEADIHSKRGIIFNFSLAISLLVVVCAFKVGMLVNESDCSLPPQVEIVDTYYPPITDHPRERQEVVKKPKTLFASGQEFKPVTDVGKPEIAAPTFNLEYTDTEPGPQTLSIEDLPVEIDTTEFVIVEQMPEPVGGYEKFLKTLYKEVRYPSYARRNEIQGKVFVQFTINEKGDLTDVKTIAGIGGGCDEEAMRAIKTTKWKAGKQRGRPVKVRMVQQVTFQLNKP